VNEDITARDIGDLMMLTMCITYTHYSELVLRFFSGEIILMIYWLNHTVNWIDGQLLPCYCRVQRRYATRVRGGEC